MSPAEARERRRAIARLWATALFAIAVTTGLVAVWTQDPRWAMTGGVLLFAALVAAVVAIP